jgi:hypothetical protein
MGSAFTAGSTSAIRRGRSLDEVERADLAFLEPRHRLDGGHLPKIGHGITFRAG